MYFWLVDVECVLLPVNSCLLRIPLVTSASFGWWNLWYAVRVTASGRGGEGGEKKCLGSEL